MEHFNKCVPIWKWTKTVSTSTMLWTHTLLDPKLTHLGQVKGLFPAFLIRPSVCCGPVLSAHLEQFKKGIGENLRHIQGIITWLYIYSIFFIRHCSIALLSARINFHQLVYSPANRSLKIKSVAIGQTKSEKGQVSRFLYRNIYIGQYRALRQCPSSHL